MSLSDLDLNRSALAKGGVALLGLYILLSELLINGRVELLIGNSIIQVLLPFGIAMYLFLIFSFKSMGLKIDRFDAVFLPIVITGLIMGLLASFRPSFLFDGSQDRFPTSRSEGNDNLSVVTETFTNVTDGSFFTYTRTVTVSEDAPPWLINVTEWFNILVTIVVAIFFIYLLFFAVIVKKQAEIEVIEEDPYQSKVTKLQKDIIEIYRTTCYRIEGKFGRVPPWYTPSKFLWDLVDEFGSPGSDYFSVLTELYELARFSSHELTDKHVEEAKEAANQVLALLKKEVTTSGN